MTRVPVPEDYDRDGVTVAGSEDYHYGEAQVNLDGRDRARDLKVKTDADGRYIGAPSWCAEAVAEYLGVDLNQQSDDDGEALVKDDSDGETYTCTGNDGACSREVDTGGGTCWQHED
jgi:hypothetical protein